MEYAHNFLTISVTGLSPFQCVYGYQPSLFSALERKVSRPSAQAFICCYRRTWARARNALQHYVGRYGATAKQRRSSVPVHQVARRCGSPPVIYFARMNPKAGTQVCRPIPHPLVQRSHQSDGEEIEACARHVQSLHLPYVQVKAGLRESTVISSPTSSSSSPHQLGSSLLRLAPVIMGGDSSRWLILY